MCRPANASPGLALPQPDRLGEAPALLGGLVGIHVRMVALQEPAPGDTELGLGAGDRQTEEPQQTIGLIDVPLGLGARRAWRLGWRLAPAFGDAEPPPEVGQDLREGGVPPPRAREPLPVQVAEKAFETDAQL